jgi:hypothetical protein
MLNGLTESEERCQLLKQKIRNLQQRIADYGVSERASDEVLALRRIQNSKKEAEAKDYIKKGFLSIDKLTRDRSSTTKETTSIRSRERSAWSDNENGDKEDIQAIVAALRKPKMKGK